MYLEHWRLKSRPFESAADTNFYYNSPDHEEALQRLLFCCQEYRGAMVLTGEQGCGKTLLSRVLVRELARDARSQIALIVNPRLSPKEFLQTICFELGLSQEKVAQEKAVLLDQIKLILDSNLKAGRVSTLIIDEAQAIENEEVLEEIRLLMNIQLDETVLMNMVFLGQPELKEKILKLKQLSQRIQMWFHIPPLNAEETFKFIQHRLHIAGDGKIFSPEACHKIFSLSGGIPRVINNICNMSLWIGARNKATQVNPEIVEMAYHTVKGG